MGWNDHLNDAVEREVLCLVCGKKYLQSRVDQQAGYRDEEEDKCPYCGNIRSTSMEYVFYNRRK